MVNDRLAQSTKLHCRLSVHSVNFLENDHQLLIILKDLSKSIWHRAKFQWINNDLFKICILPQREDVSRKTDLYKKVNPIRKINNSDILGSRQL